MVASETVLTRSLETTHPILLPPIGSQEPGPHARNPIVIGVRALCSRLEAQRRSAFSWPLGRLRGHYDTTRMTTAALRPPVPFAWLRSTATGQPQSALVGSIIVLMREMRLAGNPPAFAWARMSASFSAR